jgi:WD40 repeat protein
VVRGDAVVHRLAWSRDGKTLLTVGVTYDTVALARGQDGEGKVVVTDGTVLPNSTLELRDAKTGALKRSLGEEKYTYFTSLAFSPDGKTAAVAAMKHPHDPPKGGGLSRSEVRLFDAETWALKDKADVAGPAYALAFSPDGTRLAVGNARRVGKGSGVYVRIWEVREGRLARAAEGSKASPEARARLDKVLGKLGSGGLPVNCLAFSPDGQLLACGCFGDEDGKVCLFDGLSGETVRVLDGHAKCVSGIAFTPGGKTLVSGSFDGTVKLWDVGTGTLRWTLGQEGPVTALAFSRDGRRLATAASKNWPGRGAIKILIWNTQTWEATPVFPDQADDVASLAFSPDGSVLALGGGDSRSRDDWPAEGRCQTPGEFKLWRLR